MTPSLIVSYDDTVNDRDALALARILTDAGATASLAYVRHARSPVRSEEVIEERRALALLERGAAAIRVPSSGRHVVVHASTGEGLRELAVREAADVIVFGSDYRTADATVRPGTSAQRLLSGGPVAVAIAPAGMRERTHERIARVGVLADAGDTAAEESARTLAAAIDATVAERGEPCDLLVVGSQPSGPVGRVSLGALAEYEIETSRVPVLVVPRGVPVRFPEPALRAA
jgi:nucleotide-binding universal stress UspA family protein